MNIAKYVSALLVMLSCYNVYGQSDPILMKINGEPIPKSDFEYAYQKANNTTSSQKQSVDQFLQSFIDLKLKVAEAKSLQLDKDQFFISEYSKYLEQTQQPYVTDSISPETVAEKVYARLAKNIEVSQIFIAFPTSQVLPKDTLEAYKKIISIRESAIKGDEKKFEELVLKFSNDSVSRKSSVPGYLGWKTALMLDSKIEDVMYTLPQDSTSQPIRTNKGYYLIKVFYKRPDLGQLNLSHIFFPYPYADSNAAQKDSVRDQAQKIYEKLIGGADFAKTAAQYSMDNQSAPKGGALGWFGIGNPLPYAFEEPLYTLKKGGISRPLEMDYGFHIFNVVDRKGLMPWVVMKGELIKAITGDDRNEEIKNLERERLCKDYPYHLSASTYDQLESIARTCHIADSVYFKKIAPLDEQVLLSVGNKEYKVVDFVQYLAENPNTNFTLSTDILLHKVYDFILLKQQEAQTANLAVKHPEFRHLTNEYYDGILLFDVMDREVWTKAQNNTQALDKLFNENPTKFRWESPKYKGYVIHATDKAALNKVKSIVKQSGTQADLGSIVSKQLNTDSIKSVYVEKGLWAKGENGFVDRTIFKVKNNKEIIGYPEFVLEGKLINNPETLEDVKGQVVAEYQTILEKEWLKSLHEKYKVEINEDILKSVK